MVSATGTQGDGLVRNVGYASFRTDKEPSKGYSAELISDNVDPKYYDDMLAQPSLLAPEYDTLFKVYRRNVKEQPNQSFLGTRYPTGQNDDKGKPIFGEYQWQTYAEVDVLA